MYLKQEVIMPDTGEYKQAILVVPEARDKNFAKLFLAFSKKVMEDVGLMNGEAKLLIWFLAKTVELPIQSDLWIPIDYKRLAEDLGVSLASLKNYIARLKRLGYIEQYKTKHTTFRIKPDFLYKGLLVEYKTIENVEPDF